MPPPRFQTVPDELLPYANAAHSYLRTHGYRVRIEAVDHAAPFTPTIRAARHSTTLNVEVAGSVDVDRLKEWAGYARSGTSDTRLAVCVPNTADVPATSVLALADLGIGLLIVKGSEVAETVQSTDLAMTIELPTLGKQPPRVRQLLGHAYEQFGRGDWREGFENACNALEEEARAYFLRWSKTGRIRITRKQGPHQMTVAEIKRLSLGQLAAAFRDILAPNSLDVTIEQALSKVNPDRVERTHRRLSTRTETRLRKNVGHHMWLIVNVLKQMA